MQYNALFSSYALANIVMCFLTGYLIDRYGIKINAFFWNFTVMFGQALFTISGTTGNYQLALVGRTLMG